MRDVVSDNIRELAAPYCDPDIVTLGIEINKTTGGGCGVLLDVGSNIGSCALVWASMGHTAYAIEPMAYNVKLIKKTLENNAFRGTVTIFPVAAGDTNEDKVLYLSPGNTGDNRVGGEAVSTRQSQGGKHIWQCQ